MLAKIKTTVIIILAIYSLICLLLYFIQERLLFFPEKLSENYQFNFEGNYEEINLKTDDNISLNCLLFKAQESKGVILFLHGNGGSLKRWGKGAELYTQNNYDVFYVDYRGYGKSEGYVKSEKQLISDGQICYDFLKEKYPEDKIILSGTSMGTGIATQLAATNKPKMLLLNAPYYALQSIILEKTRVLPTFIIRYKLKSHQYLDKIACPIITFHGNKDKTIPHKHSLRLQTVKSSIKVNIIDDYGHNDLQGSKEFMQKMREILY